MDFALNDNFDIENIRSTFRDQGFVHIPDILEPRCADLIYRGLNEDTQWNLVFTDRGKHVDLSDNDVRSLPREKVQQLQQAIYRQARESFQYCYNNYPIYDAYKAGNNEDHVLHRFYEWLNAAEFLDFARQAVDAPDISFSDAQATRYKQGHFLTTHDDSAAGKNRRAAYVFNFTRKWSADWGGYLQLLNDDDSVRHGLGPTFNSLNILAVPQRHNVSVVAPFAGGVRTSISGWFRHGNPD